MQSESEPTLFHCQLRKGPGLLLASSLWLSQTLELIHTMVYISCMYNMYKYVQYWVCSDLYIFICICVYVHAKIHINRFYMLNGVCILYVWYIHICTLQNKYSTYKIIHMKICTYVNESSSTWKCTCLYCRLDLVSAQAVDKEDDCPHSTGFLMYWFTVISCHNHGWFDCFSCFYCTDGVQSTCD